MQARGELNTILEDLTSYVASPNVTPVKVEASSIAAYFEAVDAVAYFDPSEQVADLRSSWALLMRRWQQATRMHVTS